MRQTPDVDGLPWTSASATCRPLHVLIVVENNPVPLDRRVWLECGALVTAGHTVSVVCPRGPGQPLHEVLAGVSLHRYEPGPEPASRGQYARGYARSWVRTARLVLAVHRAQPVDVLQACNPPDTYFLLAALLKLRGTRFLFDQHDLCPEVFADRFGVRGGVTAGVLRMLERLTHRTADHVVTVNESCRELLLRRTSTPPDRLSVVRNGVDTRRLHPVPTQPLLRRGRTYLCVYLGLMGPQDGVETVLRVAELLVHGRGRDDVHFALLGYGDQLAPLQALSRELDLEDHVTFTGQVGDEEIASYLSTADLGLQPDPVTPFNELCSMVKTVEYLAFGLPVVAFDLRETRRTAGDAVLPVTGGVAAYADAVEQLLHSPAQRARMAAVGRERTRGPLSWERQRVAYLDVVERLGSRSAVPSLVRR